MSDQRHDAVSRRAYELWEQEGGEHGRHEDHWHRASREVDETVTAPDGTTMPIATAVEIAGTDTQAPADDAAAKPAPRRAAAKPAAQGDATDTTAKAKAPAKPRKTKAK